MKTQTIISTLVAAVALCTFPTLASANDFSDLTDFRNLYSVKVNFGKSVNQHNRFTFTGTVPTYLSLSQPLEKFNLSTGAKVGIGIGIGGRRGTSRAIGGRCPRRCGRAAGNGAGRPGFRACRAF